jgi:hypothetical protein
VDYLRTFITLVVVAFHAVIAYMVGAHFNPTFYWSMPIVDTDRWYGFDIFVDLNDAYFMSLFFFLSGLFVWPSLNRHGLASYLRERSLRLGLPWAVTVVFLIPLAYYPSYRLTGADPDYLSYWQHTLAFAGWDTVWPSGHTWFIAMLLIFSIAVAAVLVLIPSTVGALGRVGAVAERRPFAFICALVTLSWVGHGLMVHAFGPYRWFGLGPCAFQASRLPLYTIYFLAAVGVGIHGLGRGLLARDGPLARRWATWLLAGLASFALLEGMKWLFPEVQGTTAAILPMAAWSLTFTLTCATFSFALLAIFLRFVTSQTAILDNLRGDAFGIYLVHYVFIVWLQFALLGQPLPAVAKAGLVFLFTIALSWATTDAIRRIPAVGRIL